MSEQISFDQFKTLDLRVGLVEKVELHPNADRLYICQIRVGDDEVLQTVTSLVPHYTADELQGRPVVVLCNLAPARMRGLVSECMLLCAETPDAERSVLLTPSEPMPPGTPVV